MKFNPGDLAYLKTTGEKCIVLSTADNGSTFDVRRPVATRENGLSHNFNNFYAFELEVFTEQLAREFSDMETIEAFKAKLNAPAQKLSVN